MELRIWDGLENKYESTSYRGGMQSFGGRGTSEQATGETKNHIKYQV